MNTIYDQKNIAKNYSQTEINSNNLFPWSKKYLKSDSSLLDVGCGQGKTLSYLKKNFLIRL